MTTSNALTDLRGVRLGRREREVLQALPFDGTRLVLVRHDLIDRDWLYPVTVPGEPEHVRYPLPDTRAEREAIHRAVRRLDAHGLVKWNRYLYGPRFVFVTITDLGREVRERYARELAEGRAIRWPRNEDR
jgi:hypothetical protein